jgi:hypothetical protein
VPIALFGPGKQLKSYIQTLGLGRTVGSVPSLIEGTDSERGAVG